MSICGAGVSRADIQRTLEETNPEFFAVSAAAAPDGDSDFEPQRLEAFNVPLCMHCGGNPAKIARYGGIGKPIELERSLLFLRETGGR